MLFANASRRAARHLTIENVALLAAAGAMAVATVWVPTAPLGASDHIDSPSVNQDRPSDLDDLYAFVDPNDSSKVVLIMTTVGFIVSGEHFGMAIFDKNVRHRFEIENTGDARPDRFVDVTYEGGLGRTDYQIATIRLPDGTEFKATTTASNQEAVAPPPAVFTDPRTGSKFYAGVSDDPFFLDDTGANRLVGSILQGRPNPQVLGERGRDTYAGFNVLTTAVSVPASMLRGSSSVIGVNAVTQRRATQTIMPNGEVNGSGEWITVDRAGTPLVNNGLIPAPRKNEYNSASTEDDANGRFAPDIIASLKAAGTDDAHIAMLAEVAVLKGDILRLDLNVPNRGPQGGNNADGGFGKMGGRRLVDDVVDMTFTIIANGKPLGDNVPGNDAPFRNEFPFVADAIQPFPAGPNPEDRTRQ